MKNLGIVFAVVAFATTACGKQAEASDLKALLDGEALVVDVRTPAEFASGHHSRAVNIPVDQVQARIAEFGDKTKPVVLYCQSGYRSGKAKDALEKAGFKQVVNAGGFKDLP